MRSSRRTAEVQAGRQSKGLADPPLRDGTISIKDVVLIDNFGPVQTRRGRPSYAWTGQGANFSLMVRFDRTQPREVALECVSGSSEHNWINVFVECDGAMQLCKHRVEGGKHLLVARLPAQPATTYAMLRYYIQETRRVSASEAAGEGRVGVCIVRVRVSACD